MLRLFNDKELIFWLPNFVIFFLLKWSSWDFLSPLVLQRINEDNFNKSDDNDAPLCERQYAHGSCCLTIFYEIA